MKECCFFLLFKLLTASTFTSFQIESLHGKLHICSWNSCVVLLSNFFSRTYRMSVIFNVQQWLIERPDKKSPSQAPAIMSVGMSRKCITLLGKKKKNVLFTILLTFFATTVMAVAVVCFERIDSSSFRLLTIITKLTQYFFFLFFAGLHAVVLPTARLRPRCPRRCSLRINRESPCRSSDAIYGPFLFIYIYLPLNDLIFNVRDLERILNHVLSYSLAVSHELNRLSHSQFTRCVNKTC